MLPNAFLQRLAPPDDAALTAALGAAKPAWDALLAGLPAAARTDRQTWKCYSTKTGWSLQVAHKKRTIVWLSPGRGGFTVMFVLGDRAMAAARAARLPRAVVAALDAAPRYPEGTGLRLVAKSARALPALFKLAAIKAAA